MKLIRRVTAFWITAFWITGLSCLATALATAEDSAPAFSADQQQFFSEKVQPILEAECLRCHGGKSKSGKIKIKGGLALTSRSGLIDGGDTGSALNTSQPGKSLLLEMISYADEDHEMPPKGKLPAKVIKILERWILMGAPFEPGEASPRAESHEASRDLSTEIERESKSYWAYQAVVRPRVPKARRSGWHQPIDSFIAAALEQRELEPNGQADRRALVRRAYYDITGLPPGPEEIEAFAKDESPEAWEKLVDKLLASQHFGEKWARHWLDLVRYAESNGYERDSDKKEIWRYRDYVIRSFNDDTPYDQFLTEQIAGDELDEMTADSIIATGFQRLHLWDDEPSDREQARYDNLDDIVRTTSETFLGITLGCARCHDHKIDPFRQHDYYSFMSFFSNVTPMGKGNVFRSLDGLAPNRPAVSKRKKFEAARLAIQERIQDFETQAAAGLRESRPDVELSSEFKTGQVLLADSRKEPREWLYTTKKPRNDWMANRYSPDGKWRKGKGGFGRKGTPGSVVNTRWHQSAIWLRRQFRLTAIPPSLVLTIHHDENAEIYINGQQVGKFTGHSDKYLLRPLGPKAVSALQTGKNIIAIHCRQTGGGQFIDAGLKVGSNSPSIGALIVNRGQELFSSEQLRQYGELRAELEKLDAYLDASTGGGKAMCIAERGRSAPDMHVLIRGSAHARGDKVEPAFPAVLNPPEVQLPKLPESTLSTGRRRALAGWMVRRDNPLTARVMVNRIWQHYLRRGIVATPSEFGKLGIAPSHPQLLDWLAAEFMEGGWKVKRIHKLILMSNTYRMSSHASKKELAADPANNLFWRNEMRRLSAEEVRDSVLAVCGNFNTKMYGPSMFPELPPEVLATSSTGSGKWGRSPKEETERRSVYIKVKRSLVVPMLADFDFADTDAPCAVRFASTVPTQALTMLNSKLLNDQALVLARRLETEHPDDTAKQVNRGLSLVMGRKPLASEVESCLSFLKELRENEGLDSSKALNRFALLALNLNEFIYLD